jgi:hypothetical protein
VRGRQQIEDLRGLWEAFPEELAKADQRREAFVASYPDLIVIRTDAASAELAIARALALAIEKRLAKLELVYGDGGGV